MRERNISGRRLLSLPLNRLYAIVFIFGFFSITPLFAQPNNNCDMDTSIPNIGCVNGFIGPATTVDVGNGSCVGNGNAAPNVWFSFVAQGMDYTFDIVGMGGSGEITLLQFVGTPCTFGAAQQVDCGQAAIADVNSLVVGQLYYVAVTSSSGAEGPFSLCLDNPVDLPPPPNDDPCAPITVPGNGNCTVGTTMNATGDWASPNCPNAGEVSVWYQITLGATSNSLMVNLGGQSVSGDMSVLVGSFLSGCMNGFSLAGEYCGPAGATFDVNNLTPGSSYWIAVTSTDAGAGIFDICVTENGPPPACAAIDQCSGAQDISTGAGTNVCVTGCNTGTAPDNTGGGGCFDFGSIPTVWYTFTTDNNTDFVSLDINSPEFDIPQIAIYEGNCNGFTLVDCSQGASGSATLVQADVIVNTTYYIAVGSIGGQDGSFNLCLTATPSGGTNCNANTSFNVVSTSMGSPPSGPFQAGEEVEICIDVNYSSANNNCQWIHGLVPQFGNCWDPISFNPDGSPVTATLPGGGTWSWYNDGDVTYNDVPGGLYGVGDPVGAGWFVTNVSPSPVPAWCTPGAHTTDPNCSWGASQGCGTQVNYQFCVTLTTKSYPDCDNDPSNIDCGISIRTFGDGETGGWVQTGCQLDIPWFSNYSLNCCEPPDMLFTPITACSDEQIDVFLDDFVFPAQTPGTINYTWTVSAPSGVNGATGCSSACGDVLSQILENTTSSPQTVIYTVTPRTIDGCLGFPADLEITVLPSVVPEILNPNGAICSGACSLLFGSATGGIPPYSYEWSTGDGGISTEVCPTFTTTYGLTVTDGNGCTGESDIIVEANPNLVVTIQANPDVTVICESDPLFPMTLTAFADIGSSWFYNWELPSGANPNIPVVQATQSGIYYVTLTDQNGCSGESELEITVFPPATIIILPVDTLCQGDPEESLTAIVVGQTGTGEWSGPHIDIDGAFTPTVAGVFNVCYDFLSDDGCPAQECTDVIVNPIPPDPVFTTFVADVCEDQMGITYCVDIITTADSYDWIFPAGVTVTSGAGTNCITVNWNSAPSGDVCITAINGCGSSGQICQPVTVGTGPSAPTNLLGQLDPCINATGINYSIDPVTGAISYTWTVVNGTYTGSGTSINVDWGSNMVGQVCVFATTDCGDGSPTCIDIDLLGVPGAPAMPTGPVACQGEENVTYTTTGATNATGYIWDVTGGTFTGSGTSIDVDWGNNANGSVCVTPTNDCGTGTQVCLPVNLESVPADAGPITGLDQLCQNTFGEIYSIIAPNGATGYTWTTTGTGITIASTNMNQATVDFGIFSQGDVCVTPINDCGDGQQSCITISPILVPEAPTALPDVMECAGATGLSYTATAVGADNYTWDLPAGVTMITGLISATVGFNTGSLTAGIYPVCVTPSNDCGDGPNMCFDLTIEDGPAQPVLDQADLTICATDVGTNYSINSVITATGYFWTVPSGATITSGQNDTQITVDWNGTLGGEICVYAINDCGNGMPLCFDVIADQPLAPPTISCDLANTGLDQVGFTVSHPSATSFEYTWIINNDGNVLGPSDVLPILITGLSPNDEVEIFIFAEGGSNLCGDSPVSSTSCPANDCVDNPPTIQGNGSTFCPDDPATQMTASPTGGSWMGIGVSPTGMFDPATAGIGPHILTYSYTDGANCPQSGNITVVVNEFPDAEAGPEGTLSCAATAIQLDGTASDTGNEFTYSWDGPGAITNGTTLTPTVDALGIYTLTVTNTITGCIATDDVLVSPDDNSPTADAGPDQTITCNDPVATLMGSAVNGSNLGYVWTGPGIDASNENEISPMVTVDGIYTLIVTNLDNGCPSTPVTVEVFPSTPPIAEAGPMDTYTCATSGLELDGAGSTTVGNITYQWIGPGSIIDGNSLTPTINGAGTYTLLVTDVETGCTDTDDVMIAADNNSPTATVNPLVELTCNSPMQALTGGSSATNTEWIWTGPNGFTSNIQNPVVSEPGPYFLSVRDLDNGCASAGEEVTVTMAQDPISMAGNDLSLTCADPTLDLAGSGSSGLDISYLWTGPPGIINDNTLTPTISTAGIYTLIVTNDLTGCFAESTVEIFPDAGAPVADAGTDQAITCFFPTVQLSGQGLNGSSFLYTWSGPGINAGNRNDQNPMVTEGGQYFLVVEDQNLGCSSAGDPVTVTVPDPILVNAGLTQTLTCAQDNLQLDANTGTSTGTDLVYDWNGPGNIDNANTLTPTIYTSGIFTLTVSNTVTGCSESADVTIDPDLNAPTAVSGGDVDFTCLTTQVQISVSTDAANPEYTWNGPNSFNSNMANPMVTEPGPYSVIVRDLANGCDNGTTVIVNDLRAQPPVEAGQTAELLCGVPTIALDGAGTATGLEFTYSWDGPGNIIDGNTLTPTVDLSGRYELTVTNTLTGCTNTDFVDITADTNAPMTIVGMDAELNCNVTEVQLFGASTTTGNFEYTWTGPNGFTSNLQDPIVTEAGEYQLVIRDLSNNCTSMPNIQTISEATEVSAVIADANPLASTCNLSTFNLVAEGCDPSLVVEWFFNGAPLGVGCNVMFEANDNSPDGVITLIVTDPSNNCSDEASIPFVNNVQFPGALIGNPQALDCVVTEVELTGSTLYAQSSVDYAWTGIGIIGDPNQAVIEVNAAGPYQLITTEQISGCMDTAIVNVEDNSVVLQASGDDEFLDCDYNDVALEINSSGAQDFTFEWLDDAGAIVGDDPTLLTNEAGAYTVVVTDKFTGCTAMTELIVFEPDNLPVAFELNINDPTCPGDVNGLINVLSVTGGTQPFVYQLNNITYSDATVFTNLAPGTYELTTQDAEGCELSESIVIDPPAAIEVEARAESTELSWGDTTTITADLFNIPIDQIQDIIWTPENAVECIGDPCTDVNFVGTTSTRVGVTVINENGCQTEDFIELRVIKDFGVYFPNAFSPEVDGFNDIFRPYVDITKVKKIEDFIIVDRWGEIVYRQPTAEFDLLNESIGWDGKLRGKDLNPAVFVYYAKVTFIDDSVEEFSGDLTLMR